MSNWLLATVDPAMTLLETMRRVDAAGTQVALIVAPDGRLLGIATDGDIRRVLLKGGGLEQAIGTVMRSGFTSARDGESESAILDTMKARGLRQVPVVNDSGQLIGLKLLDDLVAAAECENWVVIMAGGEGRRLRPLTDQLPKPMLPIGDRPILQIIVERFIAQGFRRFFLAVNYRGEQIEQHFGDGNRWGVNISYLREPEKLGTAGALALLPERPSRPFVVMNGDILANLDFVEMLAVHQRANAVATMGIREYLHQVPYGVVQVGDGCQVVALEEKPEYQHWVNAGVYVLAPATVDMIAPAQPLDMPSLLERILAKGGQISGFPIQDYWIDIGRIEDFRRAHSDYAAMGE
jgi:dTDP-glucose pyrophosphorylase